jgi:hypothetical protein
MLQTVTAKIQTVNVAYFQREIQLFGFFYIRMARRLCYLNKGQSHIACRAHATLMSFPCHTQHMHSTAVERRPWCAVALRRTAWSEHDMGMAWQV